MNKLYWRALFGTFLLIILIAIGSGLLAYNRFSFMWFIGAIDITFCFIIMFHINYNFIKKENEE